MTKAFNRLKKLILKILLIQSKKLFGSGFAGLGIIIQ